MSERVHYDILVSQSLPYQQGQFVEILKSKTLEELDGIQHGILNRMKKII